MRSIYFLGSAPKNYTPRLEVVAQKNKGIRLCDEFTENQN